MKSMMKPVFSLIVASAVVLPSAVLAQPGKCSPCQAAKSARDAIKKSIEEAAAAALAAGGAYSREQELDMDSDSAKGCKPCQKTCRDVVAEEVEENDAAKGCKPCQKTCRDVVMDVTDATATVAACCDFCAQPGSLGCQGENSARCNTCQQGLLKMSLAEVAAAALSLVQAVVDKKDELDETSDSLRAPRESLADPCDNCPQSVCDVAANACQIAEQLRMVRCCCASVAHRLERHAKSSKKCCKSLKHEIEEIEDLVTVNSSVSESLLVSIIDQTADCCSVIDTTLGNTAATVIDTPSCADPSIVDTINNTQVDIMTWLKSIYLLLFEISCLLQG